MICIRKTASSFEIRMGKQILQIEPWGENVLRVRSTINRTYSKNDWVLEQQPQGEISIKEDDRSFLITSGSLQCKLQKTDGHLAYYSNETGELLLEEVHQIRAYSRTGRSFKRMGGELCRCTAWFKYNEDEHFYGLGQHANGQLDQAGCVIDLEQKNSEIVVPFLLSSRKYGLFWNNPAQGRVELGKTGTRWNADLTRGIDYFITCADDFQGIMTNYCSITGYPSEFPHWASGFWQCKLRYQTQDELMEVARKHHSLGLPMDVIVSDYFHWTKQGDWKFDPECWPDPKGMVEELASMGIRLMVSVWPTVNPGSENFGEMKERNLLVNSTRSLSTLQAFEDTSSKDRMDPYYYDATNPDAQDFIFEKVKKNYLDLGIDIYWLDACEPECKPMDLDIIQYHAGPAQEVGGLYPVLHEKGFYEHMKEAGVKAPINLCRSAWAGSQKFGAAVWSGDIDSTFDEFGRQIKAGLNMACSGIPYWTTDIGGFFGGEIEDPEFRELVIRWFQWALFNPIFRLHGFRNSFDHKGGSENEVWSFGEEAYQIIKEQLFMRERMRDYIAESMRKAETSGLPPMRPLFFDFPDDEQCYIQSDEFLFGDDVLVAPVYNYGRRKREVYLPEGASWQDPFNSNTFEGGQTINAEAPLERIPVYIRNGAKAPFIE